MGEDIDDFTHTQVDLWVEFYLRHRDEPLRCPTRLIVPEYVENIEMLMDFALGTILAEIDTVGVHRIVVADSRYVQQIVLMSEIQSISINPPDSLPWEEKDE